MASGGIVTVHVTDRDPADRRRHRDDADPARVVVDINKRNKQIAHGIDRVLRPINL